MSSISDKNKPSLIIFSDKFFSISKINFAEFNLSFEIKLFLEDKARPFFSRIIGSFLISVLNPNSSIRFSITKIC